MNLVATVWFTVKRLMGIVTSAHYATVDPIVDATPSRLALNELLRIQLCTPRDFGLAVADLLPSRGGRPESDQVDSEGFPAGEDLGALDDLLRGKENTWWRKQ